MAERWLSVDEIAEHLGVNPDTICKWITRKSMPAPKLATLWNCPAFMVITSLNAKSLIQSLRTVVCSLSATTPEISDNIILSGPSEIPIIVGWNYVKASDHGCHA